ncbi:MAG: AGE family epimerase/isomerase [Magnetococcales bacterium]|nr:AGE family epimerase/isomerase [Magnetococcales bacterium]
MQNYSQHVVFAGHVHSINAQGHQFTIQCRSGDNFVVKVGDTSWFEVLTNLDGLGRDRVAEPNTNAVGIERNIDKYVREGRLLIVTGIFQENNDTKVLEARRIIIMHSDPNAYVFEETHWWLTQITLLANRWLDNLFQDRRTYTADDFAEFYRTNLNIQGSPTTDSVQECATLSRLIYGLSSAFLLTGNKRYFLAAKAGVEYQRVTFRSLDNDGKYCFWAYGRRKEKNGYVQIMTSENADDRGTIPLYEQIYALAGMTQYYRISLDAEVLEDIRRTVRMFQDFYYDGDNDKIKSKNFPGLGGYFSHLDPVLMRPDTNYLDNLPNTGAKNKSRKNWNSVGDHIPAYLINLMLALDPSPIGEGNAVKHRNDLAETCLLILKETSQLIADKFPDPGSRYVNERFSQDWVPDHSWFWQQNRGIVGHNLKISWNLTRVAFYFEGRAEELIHSDPEEARDCQRRADQYKAVASKIANDMAEVGVDKFRGGIFDAMERNPKNGLPMEFSWENTKDFWQQEQGILAYLILYGATGETHFRELARESIAFWNAFFLDRDRQGVFFRTTDDGKPVIDGSFADKGGHSISGYHVFELNYLAHFYIRAYISKEIKESDASFNMYFRVAPNCGQESINVLPDFMKPGSVMINKVFLNGMDQTDKLKPRSPNSFQINLKPQECEQSLTINFKVLDGKHHA